jgi:hypothetical protein
MPAILLRLTGLDAFDRDAQTQPPDGELGEVEQRVGRGEGNTVVGADAARQAALFKQTLKGGKSKSFRRNLGWINLHNRKTYLDVA